jgi:hypothetical protein
MHRGLAAASLFCSIALAPTAFAQTEQTPSAQAPSAQAPSAQAPGAIPQSCPAPDAQQSEAYQECWTRDGTANRIATVGHPRRCQDQCISDRSCRAWVYLRTAATDNCRLMPDAAPARTDECCVTGKVEN